MKRELKIFLTIASILLLFYVWADFSGFKLLKSEQGNKWSATENPYGAVHHK